MELRQIQYFLALSRTLNFTRAAEQCNVTQPTLTNAIKKLEEELGGPLVRRERKNTHLTHLGQTVLPFLEQVYESSHAARAVARDLSDGERMPLSLGVSDSLCKARLLGPMREVQSAASGLELHVEGGPDETLASRLQEGDLDMALLDFSVVRGDQFRLQELYIETMGVLLPDADPLAGEKALSISHLLHRDWIGVVDSAVHEDFASAVRMTDSSWAQKHQAGRSTEAQVLVLSELGLTLGGDHEPLMEGLSLRALSEPPLTRRIGIAEVRGRPSTAAAMTFARLLRAQTYKSRV